MIIEDVETNISFLLVSVLLEICYILFFTFYIDAEEFFYSDRARADENYYLIYFYFL